MCFLVNYSCIPATGLNKELLFSSTGTSCIKLLVFFSICSDLRISRIPSFTLPACSLLISAWCDLGLWFFPHFYHLSHFYPNSRVPSLLKRLVVRHDVGWFHAIVWTIGRVSCWYTLSGDHILAIISRAFIPHRGVAPISFVFLRLTSVVRSQLTSVVRYHPTSVMLFFSTSVVHSCPTSIVLLCPTSVVRFGSTPVVRSFPTSVVWSHLISILRSCPISAVISRLNSVVSFRSTSIVRSCLTFVVRSRPTSVARSCLISIVLLRPISIFLLLPIFVVLLLPIFVVLLLPIFSLLVLLRCVWSTNEFLSVRPKRRRHSWLKVIIDIIILFLTFWYLSRPDDVTSTPK